MRSQGHTSIDDSLGQYLREISRFPLLGRAEEARLARGIRRGEEDALDKLVRSNLRFVVMVSNPPYSRMVVRRGDVRRQVL